MNLTSGATEFRNSVRQQQAPYSIFAVKLPIEELVTELQNRFRIESWQQNIVGKASLTENRNGKLSDLVGVPIVKFKDNPWSIVYWSIVRYLDIAGDCWSISRKFDCGSIAMYERDRSGWVEWKAYKGECEAESAQRMCHDDTVYFESHIRKQPRDLDDIEDKNILRSRLDNLIDELLVKENLSIPSLDLDLTDPNIERIDLLVLPVIPLGMRDFQKYIYQGHPEYSIFAVKADIDRVIPLLMKFTKTTAWKQDIQSEAGIQDIVLVPEESPYFLPIIQPAENQWTIVYWTMWNWESSSDMCLQISSELETFVISLGEEDTSAAFGYELFDRGKSIETLEYCDSIRFESKVREEPEFDDFEKGEHETASDFMNDRFIEEGIYIPSWELSVSDPWIDRVDLLQRNF
jgi:hypothetical protein